MSATIINATTTGITTTAGTDANVKIRLAGTDIVDLKSGVASFNAVFLENNNTINEDFVLEKNAVTAGTITINEGFTVTVNQAVEWTIV
jgi:hypothetical protein